MSNLKTLKSRIQSIESTKKITSAMKLVSSSYFKKAEKRLHAAVPYVSGLSYLLDSILSSKKKIVKFPLISGGKKSNHLLIVFSGTRGLCGGFNLNIGRRSNMEIRRLLQDGKTVKIICIGEKAFSSLEVSYRALILKTLTLNEKESWVSISNLCEEISLWVDKGEVDTCSVTYASFHSLLLSEIKVHDLIPYTKNILYHNRNFRSIPDHQQNTSLFDIDPSFGSALRKSALANLKAQLYFSMLETQASEQSSRMIAMDGATKNSEEMLKKLRLLYNRSRQATITSELVEIISGAESV